MPRFSRTLPVSALLALACGGSPAPVPRPEAVAPDLAKTLVLSDLPFAEIAVPPSSREAPPSERIPLVGPWQYTGVTRGGMHRWETDLPIRPRGLFFMRAEPGMTVQGSDGAPLRYDCFGTSDQPMWTHDRSRIVLYLPEKGTEPADGTWTLSYPKAAERELALNLATSGKAPEAFVHTSVATGWDHRSGLLLPAPGHLAWDLDLPPAAELHLTPGLVAPEVLDGPPSDGATLAVEVEVGGQVQVVQTVPLSTSFAPLHVDLSAWSGQKVRLRLRTEPGATSRFDYAFLAEPMIASRSQDPRRVLMVFVDTLRPDHLSMNGYERQTSPKVDAWAQNAAVFTQARSIAPWTLPSARSVLTGRQPEWYPTAPTLQTALHSNGFATAMFAGNVYLSANFDMHRDWDLHRVGLWPLAETVTDDALAWLDDHEGRDVFLQVHYMSCHLPYTEPPAYRTMFAGAPEGGLREEFHLSDVRQAHVEENAAAQAWIQGRYDNNIRYATDQIGRLLERFDENDVVVFYADHGEESWDHKGFEHGHSLFDELLRVPLVVDAPGLAGARIDAPVSLLDVTPTVLDALGLPQLPDSEGQSLLALARGDADAAAAFAARDQAFGRPLYGMERWGVLHGASKWTTSEGREALYDLGVDPDEATNLLKADPSDAGAPYRGYLSEVLQRPVEIGYRLVPTPGKGKVDEALVATITVPGGIGAAWLGDDYLETSAVSLDFTPGSDQATVTWHAGAQGSREAYFVPVAALAETTPGVTVHAVQGSQVFDLRPDPKLGATPGAIRTALARANFSNRVLGLTWAIAPQPDPRAGRLQARDAEMNQALEAMGYTDKNAPPDPAHPGAKAHPKR